MRIRVPTSPASLVLWFGVAGAPAAWVVQFAVGYWIGWAECSPTGSQWGISIVAWSIVVTAAAAACAAAAGVTAAALFRGVDAEQDDDPPPSGRIRFLAIVGMAITPLFFAMIVMNGVGAAVLHDCHQS
jgi:hypothetical protein